MGVLFCFLLAAGYVGCKDPLTPADVEEITSVAAKIAKCQAEGFDAGSLGAYDACMRDAGLR